MKSVDYALVTWSGLGNSTEASVLTCTEVPKYTRLKPKEGLPWVRWL